MRERLSNHDVTGRIDVCDPEAVRQEVQRLLACVHPEADFDLLQCAFRDVERLFGGRYPGYHACDTNYHDLQHTLDVTLAMARLIHGHERTVAPSERLGERRAVLGVVVALFHDAGYIRSRKDTRHRRGAEYTRRHVARSARFLCGWLTRRGWVSEGLVGAKVVHFTGYEIALDRLGVQDRATTRLGYLVGTADLIAQMSGRAYLERCRHYLYDEFVQGGIAVQKKSDGSERVIYESAEDLLRKTPAFFDTEVHRRLEEEFEGVYRFASVSFGGRNLYLEEMQKNIRYLRHVLACNDFTLLRRSPRVASGVRPLRVPCRTCAGIGEWPSVAT
jgi:hypothetical protein